MDRIVLAVAHGAVTVTALNTTRTQGITAGASNTSHYIFGYQPIQEGMKVFYGY